MDEDKGSDSDNDMDMMDEIDSTELPALDEDSDVMILNDELLVQNDSSTRFPHQNESSNQSNNIKPHDMPDLVEIEPIPAPLIAAERKRLGNEYFAKSDYKQALDMYSAAIAIMPTEAAYFGNRSACLLMMNKYKDAADDAREALKLDSNLKNGYVRLVRATLALGDIKSCQVALDAASNKPELSIDFTDETRKLNALIQHKKEIEVSKAKKDYRKTLFHTERAKEIAVGDSMLKITKAECMIKLGRFTEAQEQCTEILQSEGPPIMEACILRAYCFYQADNLDKSLHCYKQALMLAPDNQTAATYHKKIKQVRDLRELGATKFKAQKWEESEDSYKKCLAMIESEEQGNSVLESKLNFNLALVTNKSDINISLAYVNKAIDLNSTYVKAILHRASISMKQEKFDEALKDLENAEKLEPQTKDIRRMINDARIAAKRAKRKDYYKILGIDKQASSDEIKKAYKKRALVHHPDRHANASETERKDQERKFKEVLEAYEILLDDKKRRRYDSGLDVNEMPNYEQFDASQLFGNMFFTQPGRGFQHFQSRQQGFSGFRR